MFAGLPLEAYYLFLNLKSDAARSITTMTAIPAYRAQWRSKSARKSGDSTDEGASSLYEENVESYKTFVKKRRISPVELACMAGHAEAARYLLVKYDAKQAALLTACFHPHQEVELACAFLRAGASPENCLDPWGSNAVHLAARAGNLEILVAYVTGGKIDLNKKGMSGWYFYRLYL